MTGRLWFLRDAPADVAAPTVEQLRDAMPLDAFLAEPRTVTLRVVRCLCGKLHCAAGISPASRCPGCSRRLWAQLIERGH